MTGTPGQEAETIQDWMERGATEATLASDKAHNWALRQIERLPVLLHRFTELAQCISILNIAQVLLTKHKYQVLKQRSLIRSTGSPESEFHKVNIVNLRANIFGKGSNLKHQLCFLRFPMRVLRMIIGLRSPRLLTNFGQTRP